MTNYDIEVSADQRDLLGRLITQGRITVEQLKAATVERTEPATGEVQTIPLRHMTKKELSRWIDSNAFGLNVSPETREAVDGLFSDDQDDDPALVSVRDQAIELLARMHTGERLHMDNFIANQPQLMDDERLLAWVTQAHEAYEAKYPEVELPEASEASRETIRQLCFKEPSALEEAIAAEQPVTA